MRLEPQKFEFKSNNLPFELLGPDISYPMFKNTGSDGIDILIHIYLYIHIFDHNVIEIQYFSLKMHLEMTIVVKVALMYEMIEYLMMLTKQGKHMNTTRSPFIYMK